MKAKQIENMLKPHIKEKFEIAKHKNKFMFCGYLTLSVFDKIVEHEKSFYLKNSGKIVLIIKKNN